MGYGGQSVRRADEVAAGANQAAHLLEPAQAELGREVRPDRDRVGEVQRGIGQRQRRGVLVDEELDTGEILGGPGDRWAVGVAAVPVNVRVSGRQDSHYAAGGAAEVKGAAYVGYIHADAAESVGDHVGLV